MRGKKTVQLRSAVLPLLVAALVLPTVLGFRLAGPGVGLGLGALSVAGLIIFAANLQFEEKIEVAEGSRERYRLLVVLRDRALDEPIAANGVAAIAEHGSPEDGGALEPEVLVLAPAVGSGVDRWLSDVGEARIEAQARLALSVGTLAAAGLEARGQVGDPDTVLAVEDVLRTFGAHEVVFVAPDDPAIAEIRKRLDRPVRTLS